MKIFVPILCVFILTFNEVRASENNEENPDNLVSQESAYDE